MSGARGFRPSLIYLAAAVLTAAALALPLWGFAMSRIVSTLVTFSVT